jgi:hypothetical protein
MGTQYFKRIGSLTPPARQGGRKENRLTKLQKREQSEGEMSLTSRPPLRPNGSQYSAGAGDTYSERWSFLTAHHLTTTGEPPTKAGLSNDLRRAQMRFHEAFDQSLHAINPPF